MAGVHRQPLNGHCERIGSSAVIQCSSASHSPSSPLALVLVRLIPTRFGLVRR
jgi:hypothetical protein